MSALATDLALNHGTYCSPRCAQVLERYRSRTGLRTYPVADNRDLREAIAGRVGVSPDALLVGNGSGPLLKAVIPYLIEQKIRTSLARTARFLLRRSAYPLVTPRLTYSKVPAAAIRMGLRCELLPLRPDDGFALDVVDLERRLARRDGLVYLCNPNNPTGNVLVSRAVLTSLLERFPDSWFVVDEAYVHYLEAGADFGLPELVSRFRNLAVMRSFSFAYGLGAVRVGYTVVAPEVARALDAKQTPHRVGQLAADLVMASLEDHEHLDFVRETTRRERERLMQALRAHACLTVFPSQTNFVLCRVEEPRSGTSIYERLLERGVLVKAFEPFGRERFDEYFRITVGLPEENDQLIAELAAVLGGWNAMRHSALA